MARKEEHEKEPNHERWLVSYADFITLLFAVFVTLYAMAQSDKKKTEEVAASMRISFGFANSPSTKPSVLESGAMNVVPTMQKNTNVAPRKGKIRAGEKDFKASKASIDAYLLKSGANDKVTVSLTHRGLVVSLKEAGFFDSGSATLKPTAIATLIDVLDAFASYSNGIRVEGHTDNIPMKSAAFPTNWELSTTRATNVLRQMIRQEFSPNQVSAAGYAEFRPVADNDTPEGRSKNRRVDIVLLSEQSSHTEPQ